MKAAKAKQLATQATAHLAESDSQAVKAWLSAIYQIIEDAAKLGASKIVNPFNSALLTREPTSVQEKLVVETLRADGYLVTQIFERSPFGKRSVEIEW